MDDKLKQVIRNTFSYIKNNRLEITPNTYFEVFCAQAKLLNIDFDECNWFYNWINKFDSMIKKELNNYPIKNKDDFINILSNIVNNRIKSTNINTLKIIEKAIKVLNKNNLLDIDINSPLNIIDAELTKLLQPISLPKIKSNNSILSTMKHPSLLNKTDLHAKLLDFSKENYVLICDICCFNEIQEEFGVDALNKLFDAFYKILLDNAEDNEIIGIYDEVSIMIVIPDYDYIKSNLYANKIKNIINNSAFIYKNQKIDITISIKINKIKDLDL